MIILPFSDSFYLAHRQLISWNLVKHFSKLLFTFLSFLFIWNTSKVNSFSQLSASAGHNLSYTWFISSKLQWNPLIFAKYFKNPIHFLRYSGFLLINMDVSSVNVSERNSFFAYVIPSISLVLLILIYNNLTDKIKTYRETTSTCSNRIFLVNSVLRRMYASLLLKKREPHIRIKGPKLNILRHSLMYLLMIHGLIKIPGTYAFCCCPPNYFTY